LKKILLIVLILFLGALAFVATMALALFQGWPNWVGIIPLALIWGGPVAYLVGKSFLAWLARRRYAKSLLASEKAAISPVGSSPLRLQWRQGLQSLRPASFAGSIDPTKDMGWFLMLGPPSSGQSEALMESELLSSLRAVGNESQATDQVGCDWYLFDQAVILKVKGLVSEPGGAPDPVEWADFLELLKSSKRQKPLEGIVLTIPAELLETGQEDNLRILMGQIRDRLDALAQATDQSAPVYLLLTRLDVMGELAEGLRLFEASGRPTAIMLDPNSPPEAELIREGLEARFLELLIEKLNPAKPLGLAPILGAQESLKSLERALRLIISILTRKSFYAPASRIRGVFFSTRADLERDSPIQGAEDSLTRRRSRPAGLSQSLADFFSRILPANRQLTERLNLPGGRRQKIIVGLTLGVYVLAFLLALAFLIETRYNQRMSQVIGSARFILGLPDTGPLEFLGRADGLDYTLDQLEVLKPKFWPVFWQTRADKFAKEIHQRFLDTFEVANNQVMDALDSQLKSVTSTEDPRFGMTLRQLLWLYEVLDNYDQKKPYKELSHSFPNLSMDFKGASHSIWTLVYNKVLFEYLARRPADYGPKRYLERTRRLIELALSQDEAADLNWLVAWANNLPEANEITVAGFWAPYGVIILESDGPDQDAGIIPGAYTLEGREAIWDVTAQLINAYRRFQGPIVENREIALKTKFDQDYLQQWRSWAKYFLAVSTQRATMPFLDGEIQSLELGSPYNRVLELLNRNLTPFLGNDTTAIWLKNIELDGAILKWAEVKASLGQNKGGLGKVAAYSQATRAIKSHMPDYLYRTDFLRRIMEAEPLASELKSHMNKLEDMVRGDPEEAFKLVASHFGGPTYGDALGSPFNLAEKALKGYSDLIYASPDESEDLVVAMRRATIEFQKSQLVNLVARRIDEKWRSEVVAPVRFLGEEDTNKALYGPDGLIHKFEKAICAPFLNAGQGEAGYSARTWEGLKFPFTDDFLHLLTVGNKSFSQEPILDSYQVVISAVAALVDKDAREKPQRTTLTLKSTDSLQTMDIFNYPISKTFTWKPETAGDTELAIIMPSLELYLNYSGPYAFAGFLRDILRGEMILKPADFPDHQERLEALGVSEIRLIIRADGALPVIRFLELSPMPLPTSIVKAIS
jgi:type VI secretion system protein ImpL